MSLIHYLARPGWFSWQSWGPRGIVQVDSIVSGTFLQPEMMTGELKWQGWGDGRSFRGQGRRQVDGCSHHAIYRPGSFLGGFMGEIAGMQVCLTETGNSRFLAPFCCSRDTTRSQFLPSSHLFCHSSSIKANISTSHEDSHYHL